MEVAMLSGELDGGTYNLLQLNVLEGYMSGLIVFRLFFSRL